MSLAGNLPFSSRIRIDPSYVATGSVPSSPKSSVSASTAALDLVQAVIYPTSEDFLVNIYANAVTGTTGSANINISIEHSADNITFVAIPEIANPLVKIVDATNSGTGSAVSSNIQLPPSAKRYLRAKAIGEVSSSLAGGITGSYGIQLFF